MGGAMLMLKDEVSSLKERAGKYLFYL